MKRVHLFIWIIAGFVSCSALAQDVDVLNGCGFTAPTANGISNLGSPLSGDIVFDSSTLGFYGYSGTAWLGISARHKAPTVQAFTAGATGTYTTPTNPAPLYIKVTMVGAGGGGGSGYTSHDGTGGNPGQQTYFGSFLLTAGGGGQGTGGLYPGGTGGTVSVSSPAIALVAIPGGSGSGVLEASNYIQGGAGGNSGLGGGGGAGAGGGHPGLSGAANSGGGGGGAGGTGTLGGNFVYPATGGGAGGYIQAIIPNPSASYVYSVGNGGSGATGQVANGGNGGGGYLVVEEFYQ